MCMAADPLTGTEKIDLSKFKPLGNGLYSNTAGTKKVCIFMNNCAYVANNGCSLQAMPVSDPKAPSPRKNLAGAYF